MENPHGYISRLVQKLAASAIRSRVHNISYHCIKVLNKSFENVARFKYLRKKQTLGVQ
jgi:hypothetical protein